MITVKNIMVTTDLSPESLSAIEYAAWIAQKEKAHVVLFYSIDNLPTVAYHTVDLTFDKFREEIILHEQKRLHSFAETIYSQFPNTLHVVASEGAAAQTIVDYANSHDVDMIIMSTHGRTGIKHVLLGSVTERVVRTASCPVLTIKSTLPAASGAKKKKVKGSRKKK